MVDDLFELMTQDASYRVEALEISAEFAQSDAEALQIGEQQLVADTGTGFRGV